MPSPKEAMLCRGDHTFPPPWRPGGPELTRRGLELSGLGKLPAGARLADMGCGAGDSVRLLLSLGYNVVGLDREAPPEADFPFMQAELESIPLADAALDGLICECVLSLLPRRLPALREFARVTRPGGLLLLSDVYSAGSEAAVADDLSRAGWRLLHFEDHRRALALFAARLHWHGLEPACACKDASYGLWTAQKEEE